MITFEQHRVGAVLKPYADEAGPRCCDVVGFSQIANCVFASAGLHLGHVVVGFGPFQALTDAVLGFLVLADDIRAGSAIIRRSSVRLARS